MRYRNHRYITDGIIYNMHVFRPDGTNLQIAEVYEINAMKYTPRVMTEIKCFDEDYTDNKILDVRVCGDTNLVTLRTEAGRVMRTPLDARVMTDHGFVAVRDIGIETPLKVADNYRNRRGDGYALRTNGNGRVRALLRNHLIPFEVNGNDGAVTEKGTLYCVDYDTQGPAYSGSAITYGLNNYRSEVRALFDLPNFAFDKVANIGTSGDYYTIAVKVEGSQGIVTQSGIIVQATQTEIIDDW